MSRDILQCKWCEAKLSLSLLKKFEQSICPECHYPVFTSTFGKLNVGQVFVDPRDGKRWCKYDSSSATCVYASDYYQIGKKSMFYSGRPVMAY